MLFQKFKSRQTQKETWYMIIRTIADVLEYHRVDASLFYDAFHALPDSLTKSHLEGVRETILNMDFTTQMFLTGTIDINQTFGRLIVDKARNMVDFLIKGDYVLVQQTGGYCPYKHCLDIWNVEVIDEVEKEGCYFPMDTEIIETELLFIENSERVPVVFEQQIKQLVGVNYNNRQWGFINNNQKYGTREYHSKPVTEPKIIYKLSQLKLRDPNFTVEMIKRAKIIAVHTHLADKAQFEKMMGLFAQLSGKTIYIQTPYKDELIEHPLYNKCNELHKVIFVD